MQFAYDILQTLEVIEINEFCFDAITALFSCSFLEKAFSETASNIEFKEPNTTKLISGGLFSDQ